jgi:hypothetical protein
MAGLPWVQLDVTFPTSGKAIALGIALQQPLAWAHVARLWCYAAQHQADGRFVGPAAVATITAGAGWAGKPEEFVEALALPHVRLLDPIEGGYAIHDWLDYAGAHIEKREKERARLRTYRERTRTERGQNTYVRGDIEREREKKKEAPAPRVAAFRNGARKQAASDPRHAPLVARLTAAYQELRGSKYGFRPRDAAAVRDLLALGTDEEIEARWRRGLRLSPKYPGCLELGTLVSNWNALGTKVVPDAPSVIPVFR